MLSLQCTVTCSGVEVVNSWSQHQYPAGKGAEKDQAHAMPHWAWAGCLGVCVGKSINSEQCYQMSTQALKAHQYLSVSAQQKALWTEHCSLFSGIKRKSFGMIWQHWQVFLKQSFSAVMSQYDWRETSYLILCNWCFIRQIVKSSLSFYTA